jgi:hypothetical protein
MKWKIDQALDLPLAVIEDTEDGEGVCEIGERTPANLKHAHIIAAAPDLLASLESLREWCTGNVPYFEQRYECEDADAAIAKARGAA